MEKTSATLETRAPSGIAPPPGAARIAGSRKKEAQNAFSRPRGFLGNRFVYAVISQRAHGLSIGVNLNPDKVCNFDCAYCEVNRAAPGQDAVVDLEVMAAELEQLLTLHGQGRLRELPYFRTVPEE